MSTFSPHSYYMLRFVSGRLGRLSAGSPVGTPIPPVRRDDGNGETRSGKLNMRLLFLCVAMIAALLARPAIAQTAGPDTATPSVLGPIMPRSLPPPTPVAPEATEQQAMPPALTATPAAPAPELGTITAVPLPPPGSTPSAAPMPTPRPPVGTTAAGGAPIPLTRNPLTPIPLALPRLATPSAPAPSEATKPGASAAQAPAPPIVSARLPTPPLSTEASPADFLRAARGALAAGRNGEARSALEMAQTRLLDRSVDAGKESVPSDDLAVKQIADAINALASNDRMACLRYIEFASQTIGSPLD